MGLFYPPQGCYAISDAAKMTGLSISKLKRMEGELDLDIMREKHGGIEYRLYSDTDIAMIIKYRDNPDIYDLHKCVIDAARKIKNNRRRMVYIR